jgi:hypothetical protein
MLFELKMDLQHINSCYQAFREYLDSFMKKFLDDFTVYSDMESHL